MNNVAILNCDQLVDEVSGLEKNYPQMFISLFKQIGINIEPKIYNVLDLKLPDPTDHEVYIITGSKYSAYEDLDWILSLQDFIVRCFKIGRKLIGVCFGHQIIAQSLGGMVSNIGWQVGARAISINKEAIWMEPYYKQLELLVTHQDQVTRLPEGATLFGSSDPCFNEIYTIDDRVFSIQGHPEFSSDFLRELLQTRKGSIPEPIYTQALTSLSTSLDSLVVAKWIIRFLAEVSR